MNKINKITIIFFSITFFTVLCGIEELYHFESIRYPHTLLIQKDLEEKNDLNLFIVILYRYLGEDFVLKDQHVGVYVFNYDFYGKITYFNGNNEILSVPDNKCFDLMRSNTFTAKGGNYVDLLLKGEIYEISVEIVNSISINSEHKEKLFRALKNKGLSKIRIDVIKAIADIEKYNDGKGELIRHIVIDVNKTINIDVAYETNN
jgi:hypothetical protein